MTSNISKDQYSQPGLLLKLSRLGLAEQMKGNDNNDWYVPSPKHFTSETSPSGELFYTWGNKVQSDWVRVHITLSDWLKVTHLSNGRREIWTHACGFRAYAPNLSKERQNTVYLLTLWAIAVNQGCQSLENLHVCPGTALLNSRNSICQQKIQVLLVNNHLLREKNIYDLTFKRTFLFRHERSLEPSCVREHACVHIFFFVKKISFRDLESLIERTFSLPQCLLPSSLLFLPLQIEPGKVLVTFSWSRQWQL